MSESLFRKPVIGIVGGIGAGKSMVAREFGSLGCDVIDADAIGHDLLADSQVQCKLRERWGDGIFAPDGSVDRSALGAIVFAEASELSALNAILHPQIRLRMEAQIAESADRDDVYAVVLDAAVLFEAGWNELCSHIVFVDSSADHRFARVCDQRGWDEETWLARENSQLSLDIKAQMCDYNIGNSSSVSRPVEQIRRIFDLIVSASDNP